MKKRLASAVAGAAFLALALTGCSAGSGNGGSTDPEINAQLTPGTHYSFVQELQDGRKVLCVWAKDGYGGGLSCDWETIAPKNDKSAEKESTDGE